MFLALNTSVEIPSNGECKFCAKPLYGQKRKFCSVKCSISFHNAKKTAPVEAPRSCVTCSVQFFKSQTGFFKYCSKECKKQKIAEERTDPMSTYGSGKRKNSTSSNTHYQIWCQCAYDEAPVDSKILDYIEYLATDEPYVQEDLQWLDRVMYEEYIAPQYSDGSKYQADPLSSKLKKQRIDYRKHAKNSWNNRQNFGVLKKRQMKYNFNN